MEILEEIGQFIWAVLKVWQAYMTGSIVIAVLGIYERISQKTVSLRTFIIGTIVFLLVGFFVAWCDQRTTAINAQQMVDKLTKPEFTLELFRCMSTYGRTDANTLAVLTGSIVNKGADSAVLGYRAHYHSDSLDADLKLTRLIGPVDFVLPDKSVFQVLPEDIIERKTNVPIPRGGFAVGHIPLIVPGNRVKEIEDGKGIITVTIRDYLGRQYSSEFKGVGPGAFGFVTGENIAPGTTPSPDYRTQKPTDSRKPRKRK